MNGQSDIALVTGGARRIGRAITLDLAAHGFAVIVHVHGSTEEGDEVVEAIEQAGGRAAVLDADLTDMRRVETALDEAASHFGPPTLLVNNASLFENDTLTEPDREVWQRHFAIHVEAPVDLSRQFALGLPAGRGGLIVNMIDQRVLKPTPQFFSYALSKTTLWAATRTMAQALAPRVRVNAIGPGPTLPSPRQSAEDFARQTETLLLEHGPALDEFGATIRYLWQNSSITGQMITLDGGQHLAWRTPDVDGIAE